MESRATAIGALREWRVTVIHVLEGEQNFQEEGVVGLNMEGAKWVLQTFPDLGNEKALALSKSSPVGQPDCTAMRAMKEMREYKNWTVVLQR